MRVGYGAAIEVRAHDARRGIMSDRPLPRSVSMLVILSFSCGLWLLIYEAAKLVL